MRGLGLRGLLERVVDQDAEQARRVAQGSEFDLDGFVVVRRKGVKVEFVGQLAGFNDRVFVVVFHGVSDLGIRDSDFSRNAGISSTVSSI